MTWSQSAFSIITPLFYFFPHDFFHNDEEKFKVQLVSDASVGCVCVECLIAEIARLKTTLQCLSNETIVPNMLAVLLKVNIRPACLLLLRQHGALACHLLPPHYISPSGYIKVNGTLLLMPEPTKFENIYCLHVPCWNALSEVHLIPSTHYSLPRLY